MTDAYIRDHWGTTSRRKMARYLGVSEATLHRRAMRLGLAGTRRPWSEDEDELVRQQFAHWPAETLGRHLGRSPSAVVARAKKLRVSADDGRLSAAQCAELIGRDEHTVRRWIDRRELTAQRRNGGNWRVWPSVLRALVIAEPGRISWRGVLRNGSGRELVGLIAESWGVPERRSSGHADAR